MLNELEVTVEGEDTGGKEAEEEEGVALGFPAKALEKGAWDQGFPAAVVTSGVVEEEHREEETAEDGMVDVNVGGGRGAADGMSGRLRGRCGVRIGEAG